MEDIKSIKQRFEIVGNDVRLERAIEKALLAAPTEFSVLITGESGVGKEVFPRIIHAYSHRKHAQYIAVNCGAIPEGTIDSELFGHEKGSFTGALADRKGYFEEIDGGTIFLDEVGELPASTQAKLLRVLEAGEFIRVGSSRVQKTNVRVIAATNVDLPVAVSRGRFREDLYYRLSTMPVQVPPLRERGDDIILLFRKFASDVAEKYRMPAVKLTEEAMIVLESYRWPGNVRQLKNVTEQLSILERERSVTASVLRGYLPPDANQLPILSHAPEEERVFSNEREILYKVLFDMKQDMTELKKLVLDIMQGRGEDKPEFSPMLFRDVHETHAPIEFTRASSGRGHKVADSEPIEDTEEVIEESFSIEEKEKELILRALDKNHGRRKGAARDLGISERTLYRKLKEYHLDNE
jgi:DNA-binding NtrC family response regulator